MAISKPIALHDGNSASRAVDVTDCPDWGRGGSYLIDPKTGVRTLVERTAEAPDAVLETPLETSADAAQDTMKKGT